MFERYKFDKELKELMFSIRWARLLNKGNVERKLSLYRELIKSTTPPDPVIIESLEIIEHQLKFVEVTKKSLDVLFDVSKKAFSDSKIKIVRSLLEQGKLLTNKFENVLSLEKAALTERKIDTYKTYFKIELACYKEYDSLEEQFPVDLMVYIHNLDLKKAEKGIGQAITNASLACIIATAFFSIPAAGEHIELFTQYREYIDPSGVPVALVGGATGLLVLVSGLLKEYIKKSKKH